MSRQAPLKLRLGEIQDTVLDVMRLAGEPLRPTEIRIRVSNRLEREISYDTVASFLSVACRDSKWSVKRVESGRYKIESS